MGLNGSSGRWRVAKAQKKSRYIGVLLGGSAKEATPDNLSQPIFTS